MAPVQIFFDPEVLYQSIVLNIEPNGEALRLEVELRYLEYVDKWYFSVFNAETGEVYCRYVPVVASYNILNNLLSPFDYKRIGSFFCFAVGDDDSVGDPKKDTLGDYIFVWSDNL